jgi:hypothetical protein
VLNVAVSLKSLRGWQSERKQCTTGRLLVLVDSVGIGKDCTCQRGVLPALRQTKRLSEKKDEVLDNYKQCILSYVFENGTN